ncbi:hypothetical protein FO519_002743 [Halicephalobus sp. NKZ332]|nr:hypothetical protein FO519_002743 [Halicephalobus sp. NKZ332]
MDAKEERKQILKQVVIKAQELGDLRQKSDEAIVQMAESEINFRTMRIRLLREICAAELERLKNVEVKVDVPIFDKTLFIQKLEEYERKTIETRKIKEETQKINDEGGKKIQMIKEDALNKLDVIRRSGFSI